MKNPAAICLACLLGGVVVGWTVVSWKAGRGVGEPAAPGPRAGGPTSTAHSPPWGKQDFLKALERKAAPSGQPMGFLDAVVAKWTDDELRAALEETLHDPETVLSPALALVVFREFFRRDLDRALAWFQDRTALHQQVFARHLADDWPDDRAAEGLEFLLANRAAFWNAHVAPLATKNLVAASTHGAASFAAMVERLRGEHLSLHRDSPLRLAPDFDFAAALGSSAFAGEQHDNLKTSLLASWHAQAGDAAYQWMLEKQGPLAIATLPTLHDGRMPADALRWLGRKLGAMPPAERTAILDAMTGEWSSHPESIRGISEDINDATLLQDIFNRGLQGLYIGEAGDALSLLNDVHDPAERLHLLETLERIPLPAASELKPRPLEDDELESFRETLREWGADDARIDLILRRYTGEP